MFGLDIAGGLLSSAPNVPRWNDITLGAEQTKAIEQNQASLPALQNLASNVNSFNQEQILRMLRTAIPQYDELASGVSGNIASMLKGEIPDDVAGQVQSSAAARALTGGYGGSAMHGNLVARDLGLTSLGVIQQGMSSAQNWLKTMDSIMAPNFFNVSSMFVSPGQQFDATFNNQQARFSRDWMKSQIDNSYKWNNIVGASLIKTDEQLADIVSSLAGSAGGMMMGA